MTRAELAQRLDDLAADGWSLYVRQEKVKLTVEEFLRATAPDPLPILPVVLEWRQER
jgi:hypothetical protein